MSMIKTLLPDVGLEPVVPIAEPDRAGFCVVGIDPGVSGALAFYWPAYPERVLVEDVPVANGSIDVATLGARIAQMRPDAAIVEAVASRPGQGVSSVFKFGMAFGAALGVLGAHRVPVHLVSPQKWKRHAGLLSADDPKEASRALALRLWPVCAESFRLKKSHGKAEAALIARYGAEALHLAHGDKNG